MTNQVPPLAQIPQQPVIQPTSPTTGQVPQMQSPAEPPPPTPIAQVPQNPQQKSSNTTLLLVIFILLLLFIFGLLAFVIYQKLQQPTPLAPAPATTIQPTTQVTVATPTPQEIDTAPAIPASQKAKVLVHHSDSTFEVFLVPIASVDSFRKSLPKGDTATSVQLPK